MFKAQHANSNPHSHHSSSSAPKLDPSYLRSRITHRTDQLEFELIIQGKQRAYLQYDHVQSRGSTVKDVLDLQHTAVPFDLQGQGIAGLLVSHAFEFAKKENLKVRPSCTYIHTFLKKNPQWNSQVESKDGGSTTNRNQNKDSNQSAPAPHSSHQNTASSSSSAKPGDKRHSPSVEENSGKLKKSKLDDGTPSSAASSAIAASSTAATATPSAPASSSSPTQKPMQVPLPFNSIFTKKWASASAAIQQALATPANLDSSDAVSSNPSSAWSDAPSPAVISAIENLTDLARRLSLSKKDLDTRILGLQYFLQVYLTDAQRYTFLQLTFPFMLKLMLDLPQTFDPASNTNLKGIDVGWLPVLRAQQESSLNLTKLQIVSLLSCSFFGLQAEHVPVTRRDGSMTVERKFQSSNFDGLWLNIGRSVRHHIGTSDTPVEIRSDNQCEVEKVKCLLVYFERMRVRIEAARDSSNPHSKQYQRLLRGIVTFHRKVVNLNLAGMESRLTTSSFASKPVTNATELRDAGETIEDQGYGTLEIDFANKLLGGGVLKGGCIQEEIRLTINPECLVGLLFVEVMAMNESVTMIGAERFANYSGYSDSFQYVNEHFDPTPIDPLLNRMKTVIVAVDAISFRRKAAQYETHNILREILKAFAGFALEDSVLGLNSFGGDVHSRKSAEDSAVQSGALTSYILPPDSPSAVFSAATSSSSTSPLPTSVKGITDIDYSFQSISTGNWGCGAFGAEVPLKALIQILAATLSRRQLRYFTFGSPSCAELPDLLQVLADLRPSVKQLYNACIQYHPTRSRGRKSFEHFRDLLDGSEMKKFQEWKKQKQEQDKAAAASAKPSLNRPAGVAAGTTANAASAAAGELEEDPIENFPEDNAELDAGFNSEDEKAALEAEELEEGGLYAD